MIREGCRMYVLGYHVAHVLPGLHRYVAPDGLGPPSYMVGGAAAGAQGAARHLIHQIVYVHHVPRRIDAGHTGGIVLVHMGPARDRVDGDPHLARKLVLRNQPHREEKRVAGHFPCRLGQGAALLVHLAHQQGFHALAAAHLGHCAAQVQRDVEIAYTLYQVTSQAAHVGEYLEHSSNLCPL